MEALYLLIPFSVALVLALLAVFAWALRGGQFEDVEREGERILEIPVDEHQREIDAAPQQSSGLL
jgi:cbb3-type cytochrome oxidase maturation protein